MQVSVLALMGLCAAVLAAARVGRSEAAAAPAAVLAAPSPPDRWRTGVSGSAGLGDTLMGRDWLGTDLPPPARGSGLVTLI